MFAQPIRSHDLFTAASTDFLRKHGVTLSYGSDFRRYHEEMFAARENHLVSAPFDPDLHELNEKNALWIVGKDRSGEIMHTQALRLIDTSAQSLGLYLMRNFWAFPPPGVDIDYERSRYRAGPGAMRMTGQIAYHGEFWLRESGEYRGSGLSSILSRCGFWEAKKRWDPEHIIAFMVSQVAHKGLAARAGWMHTEPSALKWFINGRDAPVEGFMAYVHREDVDYLLDIAATEELPAAA